MEIIILENHTSQVAQTRGHANHTAPFRMTNTSHEQQGFHHKGSSRPVL